MIRALYCIVHFPLRGHYQTVVSCCSYHQRKEIDWFGKRCFLLIQKNAWHSPKPPGEDERVRATNGGNFFVISPDKNNPNTACTIFSLSNNNYNGWLPKTHIEWLVSRAVVSSFNRFLNCMIEGYEKYYKLK